MNFGGLGQLPEVFTIKQLRDCISSANPVVARDLGFGNLFVSQKALEIARYPATKLSPHVTAFTYVLCNRLIYLSEIR